VVVLDGFGRQLGDRPRDELVVPAEVAALVVVAVVAGKRKQRGEQGLPANPGTP
jgi:hypothetical protein